MDIADYAQEINEKHLKVSLLNRRILTIPFSGECLCCQQTLETQRRFCDSDCREQWELARKRQTNTSRSV